MDSNKQKLRSAAAGGASGSLSGRHSDPQGGAEVASSLKQRMQAAVNKVKNAKRFSLAVAEGKEEKRKGTAGAAAGSGSSMARAGPLSKRLGLQANDTPGALQQRSNTTGAKAAFKSMRAFAMGKDAQTGPEKYEDDDDDDGFEDEFVDKYQDEIASSSDDDDDGPPPKSASGRTPAVAAAAATAAARSAAAATKDPPLQKPPQSRSGSSKSLPVQPPTQQQQQQQQKQQGPQKPSAEQKGKKQKKDAKYFSGYLLKGDDADASRWGQVNEEIMLRRVRDVRQARGDRITKAQGNAVLPPLLGSKGRSPSSSQEELMDPLGKGPINLGKQCLAANAGKVLASEKVDEAMAEKIVPFSENFDSAYYLAKVHGSDSIEDLEAGQQNLRTDLASQQEQLRLLVKHNFESFVTCKTTMEDIELRIREMHEESGTEYLQEAIVVVDEATKTAFGPLLERQAQVDRIRSAQGFLGRFRTIFNLPAVMRSFVEKEEFDNAVHEYFKAKSISLPSHSNILKRVMAEVQKVVLEFREVLYMKMDDPDADPAQVENSIRLLLELEPESDPIWHYLTLQDRRIRGLLEGCVVEHESKMEKLRAEHQEKEDVEKNWTRLQIEANKSPQNLELLRLLGLQVYEPPLEEDSLGASDTAALLEGEEYGRLHARLVKRLTLVLQLHVPRFWRLALSVFAGKFAKFTPKEAGAAAMSGSSSFKSRADSIDRSPSMKYSKHSVEEVTAMVVGMVAVYKEKVQNAFAKMEIAVDMRAQLRQAVEDVAAACSALSSPGSAPLLAVQELYRLRVETATRFVQRVCATTRNQLAEVVAEEDWAPVPNAMRMHSPYAISSLPLHFKDHLSAALDDATEILQAMVREEFPVAPPGSESPHDAALQEDVAAALLSMFHSVKTTFREAFFDLSSGLSQLGDSLQPLIKQAVEGSQGASGAAAAAAAAPGGPAGDATAVDDGSGASSAGPPADGGPASRMGLQETGLAPYVGLRMGSPVTTAEQRILLIMSNAAFSRSFLARELADKYHHLWTNGVQLNEPQQKVRGSAGSSAPALSPQQLQLAHQQLGELRHVLAEIEESFLALEVAMGEQYISIKAGHLGLAVIKYFLEDATSWAAAPPVKGLRDSALELIHPLVAVYAEVHAGCRPFVDKAINTLADGLMDAVHQVAFQHEDLQLLDCNAYCQLHLELDFFDTLFKAFSSPPLEEIMQQLRDMLLTRALQTMEQQEELGAVAGRAPRSGSFPGEGEEALPRNAAELKAMGEQISAELLPLELRRTRVNIFCFLGKVPVDYSPPPSAVLDAIPARMSMMATSAPAVYTPSSAPPLTPALAASLPLRGQAPTLFKGASPVLAASSSISPPLRGNSVDGLRASGGSLKKPSHMRLAGTHRSLETEGGMEFASTSRLRGHGSMRSDSSK